MQQKHLLIQERYQHYKEIYPDLPVLDHLNRELECVDFLAERKEVPQFFLAALRRRLVDVVGSWINYLHNFVLPNQQSMILVHEAESISREERDTIIKLINKLMFVSRLSAKLELEKDEAQDAKFVTEQFSKWLSIKEKIKVITHRNIEIWQAAMQKQKIDESESNHYVG